MLPPIRRLLSLTAALAVGLGAAEPLARSPFLPPPEGAATGVAVTENAPLQFCGMLGDGEGALFNIFNPSNRRSQWVRVGQETETYTVRSYDADAETLVVAQASGQTMTLRIEAAKPASGPGASVGPLPVAGSGLGGNALTATVKVNPTPADEARRLEAVAAEVRRRRALRQSAAEQAAQNAANAGP